MSEETNLTGDLATAAHHLTFVANGLARRYGAPEALHLLWAAALSLARANMAKSDVVAYLRATADKLQVMDAERPN